MKSVVHLFVITFVAFFLGGCACFVLRSRFGFSPIFAASLSGFLVTFVPLSRRMEAQALPFIFCTGTFVAMSSPQIISSYAHVLEISVLGSALYLIVQPYFSGIGGKMGAIAFVATALWVLLGSLA